jgi:hypothetical protein
MAKKVTCVALQQDGSLEHYYGGSDTYTVFDNSDDTIPYWERPRTEVPYNKVPLDCGFTATLVFDSLDSNYRSGAHATLKDESTGATFSVFLAAFEEMIPLMKHGKITANFKFRKQGSNQSLILAP